MPNTRQQAAITQACTMRPTWASTANRVWQPLGIAASKWLHTEITTKTLEFLLTNNKCYTNKCWLPLEAIFRPLIPAQPRI